MKMIFIFEIVRLAITAAALAAMSMQEELRLAQTNKGDDRLAMRIVIRLRDCSRPQRMVWVPPAPRMSKLRKHFCPRAAP